GNVLVSFLRMASASIPTEAHLLLMCMCVMYMFACSCLGVCVAAGGRVCVSLCVCVCVCVCVCGEVWGGPLKYSSQVSSPSIFSAGVCGHIKAPPLTLLLQVP